MVSINHMLHHVTEIHTQLGCLLAARDGLPPNLKYDHGVRVVAKKAGTEGLHRTTAADRPMVGRVVGIHLHDVGMMIDGHVNASRNAIGEGWRHGAGGMG